MRPSDRTPVVFSAPMRNSWNRCVRFVHTPWCYRRKFRIVRAEELPDQLKKHRLYAIGEGVPWLAALQCPCGCGEIVQLPRLENDRPRWRLRREKDGSAHSLALDLEKQRVQVALFSQQGAYCLVQLRTQSRVGLSGSAYGCRLCGASVFLARRSMSGWWETFFFCALRHFWNIFEDGV